MDINDVIKKKLHENLFDHIFFSQLMAHQLEHGLSTLLTKNGTFSIETPKYIFPLSRTEKEKWFTNLFTLSKKLGFHQLFSATDNEPNLFQNDKNYNASILCFTFESASNEE